VVRGAGTNATAKPVRAVSRSIGFAQIRAAVEHLPGVQVSIVKGSLPRLPVGTRQASRHETRVLPDLLERAWRLVAPKALVIRYDKPHESDP